MRGCLSTLGIAMLVTLAAAPAAVAQTVTVSVSTDRDRRATPTPICRPCRPPAVSSRSRRSPRTSFLATPMASKTCSSAIVTPTRTVSSTNRGGVHDADQSARRGRGQRTQQRAGDHVGRPLRRLRVVCVEAVRGRSAAAGRSVISLGPADGRRRPGQPDNGRRASADGAIPCGPGYRTTATASSSSMAEASRGGGARPPRRHLLPGHRHGDANPGQHGAARRGRGSRAVQ